MRQQNILWLEIAVNNLVSVAGGHCFSDLSDQRRSLGLSEGACAILLLLLAELCACAHLFDPSDKLVQRGVGEVLLVPCVYMYVCMYVRLPPSVAQTCSSLAQLE